MREGEFPSVANCDKDNPEEAFLPYLVGIPGMKGASLVFPVKYLRLLSKRLWDGGARLTEEPVIFYHPPALGDMNTLTAAGEWKDTPPPPLDPIPDVSLDMKRKLMRKWNAEGVTQ